MPDEALHSNQESSRDPLIGQSLNGKYVIEEKIAVGGMCSVYRAVQLNIGKTVAVKVLLPQLSVDEQIVRRFEQEARAASLIHHPHAINVFDFGYASNGRPFIVMDFIRGESLDAVLRREGALPLSRAVELLMQICGALQAAHEQGVVHRDVKPGNIIISETDGQDWVTVVDFGVAKIQEDLNRRSSLTAENVIVGTPRYMSPEQAEGGAVDARSDIYSLGVVLYEMLAGEALFSDDSSTRLLLKHVAEPPLPLRKKRPDLPVEVERVVMKTLAKEPAARPASALELSKAFTAAVAGQAGNDKPMGARRRSRIVVPLGKAGAAGATESSHVDEEATILRPSSRRRSVAQAVFPFVQGAARRANKRSIAVLILLVAAGLGVIGMKSLTGGADEVSAAIAVAQATVDLAIARIDGLPADHTLRRRLPQLSRWEDELSGYLTTQERSAEIESRVSAIERAAGRYAEQARRAMEEETPEDINAGERDQEKELDEDEDEEWEKELETEREKDEREYEKQLEEKRRERDKERREKWNPFRKLKKLFE